MKKECLFIDVFTDIPYTGNQLAVFPDVVQLTQDNMQALANEINYSETTFIVESQDPSYDFQVRIFNPKNEMPFAGHPILGTAFAIIHILKRWDSTRGLLRLKTQVGVIPIEIVDGVLWMQQNQPEFYGDHTDKEKPANFIGLSPDDLMDELPVEEVSTGNRMMIIPVKTLDAVRRAEGNVLHLKQFFGERNAGPYLFTFETTRPEAKVHTRFFAPHLGIIEDAATGSAAGPLTAYLLKHSVFGERFEIINEQGVEMNRPSQIHMKGEKHDDQYVVKIGGRCVFVGTGEFTV
ncbi:MAG: PhzF family phenazine biosynthesis protein [candidate division WOR-3 bacterium]|nr:MAG: PhzF family phenazine biosynthesis protein [candidate division WOR-3 bacterium]